MGSCLCKDHNQNGIDASGNDVTTPRDIQNCGLAETIDKLVSDTLDVIGTVIDNEPEPPSSILLLHIITDKPSGWIELVRSLMRVVPVEHPMGPSVIALLLDDSPLPTRESVHKVANMLNTLPHNSRKERNLCVILGCLAEKLAGPGSIDLINESVLHYLIGNLQEEETDVNIKLLSLIALEKFSQTSENKATIRKTLAEQKNNTLLTLETYATSNDFKLRQIGFCARWCLDNYFSVEGRKYSYETTDVSNINVMLNTKDVSEYLKISPDGLEARCDAYTFESVRCTFKVNHGCWFYEVLIITPGVMQIGWATKESNFLSDDGYGIGDDKYSIGFDGCRKLVWHNAKSIPHNLPVWQSGSILGCLLDLDKLEIIFSLNGQTIDSCSQVFSNIREGFFAAASFMSFQQCRFNFGLEPFHYPPKRSFQSFNSFGHLKPQDKIILPRHIYLNLLRKVSVRDDSCTLCFDNKAVIKLEPCHHSGFCLVCAEQLKFCPMCRAEIREKLQESNDICTNEEQSIADIAIKNKLET